MPKNEEKPCEKCESIVVCMCPDCQRAFCSEGELHISKIEASDCFRLKEEN
jgi:hypothetical protein